MQLSDTSTGKGKVVVNRVMSLDGFIAGPGDAMGWIFDFLAEDYFRENALATGAMRVGRRTYEVGKRMNAGKAQGSAASGGGSRGAGPALLRPHGPRDPP